ncbi:MAG: hypothetical protein B0D91_11690, partial [Oceanospirillales bacterium LUC14_002_19_P2]
MVSAFAAANGVVLGQVKTEEKSNEITAIPELLELLEIKGALFQVGGSFQSLLSYFQIKVIQVIVPTRFIDNAFDYPV